MNSVPGARFSTKSIEEIKESINKATPGILFVQKYFFNFNIRKLLILVFDLYVRKIKSEMFYRDVKFWKRY